MYPILHFESYILWFLVSSSILIHATTGVDSYSTDEKRFNSKEKRNGEENKIFLWKIERDTSFLAKFCLAMHYVRFSQLY